MFIGILLGSFSLGTALPEMETFGSAMGAATAVFEIIDRVSGALAGVNWTTPTRMSIFVVINLLEMCGL